MNTKEKIAVMQAYVDGKPIEMWNSSYYKWERFYGEPDWNWENNKYRVVQLKPDSIDWSHVHPDFKFMARCESGSVYLFKNKPILKETYWWASSGIASDHSTILVAGFASFKQGDVDWKDSLVERAE